MGVFVKQIVILNIVFGFVVFFCIWEHTLNVFLTFVRRRRRRRVPSSSSSSVRPSRRPSRRRRPSSVRPSRRPSGRPSSVVVVVVRRPSKYYWYLYLYTSQHRFLH